MNRLEYFKARLDATMNPVEYMHEREQQSILVLDVREGPPQALSERIPGSIHIPCCELNDRMGELPNDKLLLVYGWDVWCNLCAKACVMLLERGYDVKEMVGGIAAWNALDMPISSSPLT